MTPSIRSATGPDRHAWPSDDSRILSVLAGPETVSTTMWYRASLDDEQIAAGFVAAIRSQFAKAVQSAGEPSGACLFVTSRQSAEELEAADDSRLNDEDAVYFSPASVAAVRHMIAHYNALPSPPPIRSRASLLVGQPSDWDLLPRSTH